MTNTAKQGVRTPDIVQAELKRLKDTSGLSWRELSRHPEYAPIPAGTLNAIYKGYPIPKRWHRRLGLREMKPAPACQTCGEVHPVDDLCKATNVYIEMTADEVVRLPAPPRLIFVKPGERVKVEKPKAPRKPSRPRVRVELPADLTPDERAIIMKLTPEERRKRLLGKEQ
jgi:hypothetical protein